MQPQNEIISNFGGVFPKYRQILDKNEGFCKNLFRKDGQA
jgi:hypothetical protein